MIPVPWSDRKQQKSTANPRDLKKCSVVAIGSYPKKHRTLPKKRGLDFGCVFCRGLLELQVPTSDLRSHDSWGNILIQKISPE